MAPSDPLKIYASGLRMESAEPSSLVELPPQVFSIALDDDFLANMIQAAQMGQQISISMGNQPAFEFDDSSYPIPKLAADSATRHIFFSKPLDDNKLACNVPVLSDLHSVPEKPESRKPPADASRPVRPAAAGGKLDIGDSLEMLQSSMAKHEANRGGTVILGGDMNGARNPNVLRAAESSASQPTSPSMSIRSGSPAPAPESGALAKSVLERNKKQRFMIVHELAVQDRSREYLEEKWEHRKDDFESVLKKAADYISSSKLWSLNKKFWRELDVWEYDYENPQDRQTAIDNAIAKFDKLRVSLEEAEWDRLLPEEERGKGKGKTLSKLQANFRTPMGTKALEEKNESAARSKTAALPKAASKKEKKTTSTAPSKPASTNTSAPTSTAKKITAPKASKAKSAPTSAPANRKMPLSAEIIESDDDSSLGSVGASSDEHSSAKMRKISSTDSGRISRESAPQSNRAVGSLKAGMASKLNANATPVNKSSATKAASTKVSRTTTTQKPSSKRSRDEDEDDGSSRSSTPPSKRAKVKTPARAPEALRMTPSSSSNGASKKTMSPLPRIVHPVSPSSVSDEPETTVPNRRKPLATDSTRDGTTKSSRDGKLGMKETKASKPRVSANKVVVDEPETKPKPPKPIFEQVVNKAARFKLSYHKYHLLHDKVSKNPNPPLEEVNRLKSLHEHLQNLKQAIYDEHLLCQQ